jgi:hypothetical protein
MRSALKGSAYLDLLCFQSLHRRIHHYDAPHNQTWGPELIPLQRMMSPLGKPNEMLRSTVISPYEMTLMEAFFVSSISTTYITKILPIKGSFNSLDELSVGLSKMPFLARCSFCRYSFLVASTVRYQMDREASTCPCPHNGSLHVSRTFFTLHRVCRTRLPDTQRI